MKKKLIGISVATIGVVLSIGSAIALYTKAANETSFGISAGTYAGSTGTIAYKINNTEGNSNVAPVYYDSEGAETGVALSSDFPQIKYEFALGGSYSETLIAQPLVMGKVTLTLNNLINDLNGKLTVYAAVQGYTADTVGASMYGAALVDNQVVDAEHSSIEASRDISVSCDGTQKLVVWLKFQDLNDLALAEKNNLYTLNVSWGELSDDFNLAYIQGDTTQWHDDEKYAMVVNIEANAFEWMFENIPGSFGPFKVHCGDTWCHEGANHTFENAELSYAIFWKAGQDIQILNS